MNYWLVKSEPFKYSWQKFQEDTKTHWDGVRNFQARNNLKAMKKGDLVLFYHSNEGKEIVGIAEVVTEFYQDPTTEETQWVVVDLAPYQALETPVSLETIKKTPFLAQMGLIKQSRLSVMPVKKEEFDKILELSAK